MKAWSRAALSASRRAPKTCFLFSLSSPIPIWCLLSLKSTATARKLKTPSLFTTYLVLFQNVSGITLTPKTRVHSFVFRDLSGTEFPQFYSLSVFEFETGQRANLWKPANRFETISETAVYIWWFLLVICDFHHFLFFGEKSVDELIYYEKKWKFYG